MQDGQTFTLTSTDLPGTDREISINYPHLPRDVKKGNRIPLDDGNLELVVESMTASAVTTRVVRGGVLKEHKGVNLPGVSLDVPSLTEKDLKDLEFGLHLGLDYLALSFVRRARDIERARAAMEKLGTSIPIIAKLEKAEAVSALDEILAATDGVMVARGDLGVELAPEWVPVLQKTIVERRFSKDELLTNITIYWVTGSINSSFLFYYDRQRAQGMPGPIKVLVGIATFPKEIFATKREWAERDNNITRWTDFSKGGLFPAAAEPALLARELREFFRPLRP